MARGTVAGSVLDGHEAMRTGLSMRGKVSFGGPRVQRKREDLGQTFGSEHQPALAGFGVLGERRKRAGRKRSRDGKQQHTVRARLGAGVPERGHLRRIDDDTGFLGDLTRTQAFPSGFKPGDPYTYQKCNGPNDPRGSFRYCNTLDKDAAHYDGYAEPSWFNGGIRPLIFPWLVLPELGFTWKPTPSIAVDLEGGVTLSGFLTGLGVRVGL